VAFDWTWAKYKDVIELILDATYSLQQRDVAASADERGGVTTISRAAIVTGTQSFLSEETFMARFQQPSPTQSAARALVTAAEWLPKVEADRQRLQTKLQDLLPKLSEGDAADVEALLGTSFQATYDKRHEGNDGWGSL